MRGGGSHSGGAMEWVLWGGALGRPAERKLCRFLADRLSVPKVFRPLLAALVGGHPQSASRERIRRPHRKTARASSPGVGWTSQFIYAEAAKQHLLSLW